jgi:hypothetical protein
VQEGSHDSERSAVVCLSVPSWDSFGTPSSGRAITVIEKLGAGDQGGVLHPNSEFLGVVFGNYGRYNGD